MYEVEVKTIPETPLIYVPHQGPYQEISEAYERLMGALFAQDLMTGPRRMFAVFYDDPAVVPAEELRSRAAAAADGSETVAPPLEKMVLPGGTVAVLHHRGPYTTLIQAYTWLYGEWLPQSGYGAGDEPSFEEYLNDPQDTPPPDLLTDIYVPLRSGQ